MPDGTIVLDSGAARLLDRLPVEIAQGLTPEQKAAIAAVLTGRSGRSLPVNLRLSVPIFGWRLFFTVLAGHDQRSAERRANERARHPVHTAGNFLFVVAGAMVFYAVALVGFLLWSSVLEF